MASKKKPESQSSKATSISVLAKDYVQTLHDIKEKVDQARIKAALATNKELLLLYWEIGKTIAKKQKYGSWGSRIIERLAKDLHNAFPGIEGFSTRNISRMKSFYQAYAILPQPVAKLESLPILNIP